MLKIAHEESETPTALIPAEVRELVEHHVTTARKNGAQVVFIDGMPRTAEDVQWLYDQRYVYPGSGALVRVDKHSVRDEAFLAALPAIDDRAVALSLPYFVVRAEDIEVAILDILARSGIER